MNYEYKQYSWYSQWLKRVVWCNSLFLDGKLVWQVADSNNPISKTNAIKMYESEKLR